MKDLAVFASPSPRKRSRDSDILASNNSPKFLPVLPIKRSRSDSDILGTASNNSPKFLPVLPIKRSRSDSDILGTASNNSPKFLLPIKRFKLDTPVVKIQTSTPTVAKQTTPVFALPPIKQVHSHIPVVKKTHTATVKRKKTGDVCTANTLFVDILQHHLKIRSLVSPRDVLLFLGTGDRFRLLPKLLHKLDSMIDRIEHIYRTNLSAGFSLLLPGTKIRMRVTPSVATKLVTLDKLFRRSDLCLKAYVRRSINTSSSSQSSQDACLKKLN